MSRLTRSSTRARARSHFPGALSKISVCRSSASAARTSAGSVVLDMYGVVKLTIQGRDWNGDVVELPDECPALIGQLPLEGLDFVVDPAGQRLNGNPEHGGEHVTSCVEFLVAA